MPSNVTSGPFNFYQGSGFTTGVWLNGNWTATGFYYGVSLPLLTGFYFGEALATSRGGYIWGLFDDNEGLTPLTNSISYEGSLRRQLQERPDLTSSWTGRMLPVITDITSQTLQYQGKITGQLQDSNTVSMSWQNKITGFPTDHISSSIEFYASISKPFFDPIFYGSEINGKFVPFMGDLSSLQGSFFGGLKSSPKDIANIIMEVSSFSYIDAASHISYTKEDESTIAIKISSFFYQEAA